MNDWKLLSQQRQRCSDCGKPFPATLEFFEYARKKGGLTSRCRPCLRVQRKGRYQASRERYLMTKAAWRKANPQKVRETLTRWREANRQKARSANTSWWTRQSPERITAILRRNNLRQFGMTEADYVAILASQDGKCAICQADRPGARRRNFAVDHCHNTKVIRGLLCNRCNLLIGIAKDDIGLLRTSIDYLERNPNATLLMR